MKILKSTIFFFFGAFILLCLAATVQPTATTGYFATNLVQRAVYKENAAQNPVNVIATNSYQTITTNTSYAIGGFVGLVSGDRNCFTICWSNSGASAINVTNPANIFYFGSASSNLITIPSAKMAYGSYDIRPGIVSNACNVVQQ